VEGKTRSISAVIHNPIEAGFFELGETVNIDFNSAAAHLLPA